MFVIVCGRVSDGIVVGILIVNGIVVLVLLLIGSVVDSIISRVISGIVSRTTRIVIGSCAGWATLRPSETIIR